MVLVSGIGKLSPESKNTLNNNKYYKYSQIEGLKSEEIVINYFQEQGWNLVFQRLKTKIAEIDLVFEKVNQIKIVEVKKLNNPWRAFERISDRQHNKLISNQIYLSSKFFENKIEANICWVNSNGQVWVVEVN